MAKLNLDEDKSLSEAIEIVVDGKTYSIEKVTFDFLDKITAMGKEQEADLKTPVRQLAALLNTAPEEFKYMDIRKVNKALAFITKTLMESLEKPSKNA